MQICTYIMEERMAVPVLGKANSNITCFGRPFLFNKAVEISQATDRTVYFVEIE